MKHITLSVLLSVISLNVFSQLVQWRGPSRNGIFLETGLLNVWPEGGPEQILEVEKIGKGWSSPILAGNMIYATGMIDTLDYLSAIDLQGNIKWQVPYGKSWNKSFPDTRSTPTVEDDRIYVQSGTGRLSCFERETGKEIWAVEVDRDFEGEYHIWGNSETPLIVDNKVICTPGGQKTSVVAFDKMTGKLLWKSKSLGGQRVYASPTIYQFNAHRYILAVIGTDLIAVVPETGEIAWSYKYHNPEKWNQPGLIWTNTPVFNDERIFLTKGYNYNAKMLQMALDGKSVSEVFTDTIFDNHHHGVILHDGFLYGSNWINNNKGNWVCMEWDTGKIMWEHAWDSKGAMIMADGLLYTYNEKGNVGLIQPSPDGFKLISEFKITKGAGPHWAHPFIADGKLLIRHGDVLMVYDVKKKWKVNES
ncbi:MAG: hypothetical protein FD181_3766 [Prolixibacteraceae bacterium]|nr:MAG: hypothetical protein FD181_3766 [Prolixibacteraceae bacterium]